MASSAQPSCVIYVRVSQDRTGEELAVDRHEKDCRKLAERLGFRVDHVFSDNDQSATSGKPRPSFEAMLASKPKAIVAWHQDRLLRLTKDLERVIDVGAPVYFVTSAENGLDLASPAGRAVARTVAAWSQYEGEQKRLRQVSKNQQLAEHGHWQFSLRPYGYERTNGAIRQVPEEIAVLKEGYEEVLAGRSYRQVAADWNARGIKPLIGEHWMGSRVQRLLENSHYGGIPSYKGEEVELAKGRKIQWVPVLSPRRWQDFRELKLNRKKKRSWAVSPKHLMSGMLTCAVCNGSMFSHAQDVRARTNTKNDAGNPIRVPVRREDGSRVKKVMYVCFANHCTSIRGEFVDDLVRASVLKTLDDERIARALRPDDSAGPLEEEIEDLQRRRDDVTDLLGDGLMDKARARAKLAEIGDLIEVAMSKLAAIRSESPLSDIRLAESIPRRWDQMSILERRRTISDLGLRFKVHPARKGARSVDPASGSKYSERAWALLRVEASQLGE